MCVCFFVFVFNWQWHNKPVFKCLKNWAVLLYAILLVTRPNCCIKVIVCLYMNKILFLQMFKKINWPEGTSSDTWNTMTEDCAEVIHDMLNNTLKRSSKDSILAPFLSILTFQLPRAFFENLELVSFVTWFQLATRINRLFLYHWRNSFHNSRWMHGCRKLSLHVLSLCVVLAPRFTVVVVLLL